MADDIAAAVTEVDPPEAGSQTLPDQSGSKEGLVWFNSHAHLQSEDYQSDWQSVVGRASQAGVWRILLPSSSYADAQAAIALASRDQHLVCAIGCHPHEADTYQAQSDQDWLDLLDRGQTAPVVAIGEIGLDYHYDFSPRPVQQQVFRKQLVMAFQRDLPVIIHEREATADCLAIVEAMAADGKLRRNPGVFHCYSGSVETAARLLRLGFYLGFDGPVTFKNARRALAVIEHCPHDRLLLETDSPYLTPVPYRGRRNEPSYLPLIGAKVAEIWQTSPAAVARQTTENACRLFNML